MICGKSISGRGNSKGRCPEVRVSKAHCRYPKTEWMDRWMDGQMQGVDEGMVGRGSRQGRGEKEAGGGQSLQALWALVGTLAFNLNTEGRHWYF